jgi:hypothetical protein
MKKISLSTIIVMSIISFGGQSASGIDIYQQQLNLMISRSQSIDPSINNSSMPKRSQEDLDTVKTKSDAIEFLFRKSSPLEHGRIRVIGTYKSISRTPTPGSTGNPNFQGTYTTASILLVDGTEIPIFPTYNKQSLRSTEEVKIYTGKIVNVIGRIELQFDRPGSTNSTQSIMLTSFDRIHLDPGVE